MTRENSHHGSTSEDTPEDTPTTSSERKVVEEATGKDAFRFFRVVLHWGFILFVLLHGEPDLLDSAIKILSKFGGK